MSEEQGFTPASIKPVLAVPESDVPNGTRAG